MVGDVDGSEEGGGVSVDCELNAGGGDESIRTLFAGRGLSSVIVMVRAESVDRFVLA